MKVVQLTTDKRENERWYSRAAPEFATFSEALFMGFRDMAELEVHVVSCHQRPVSSPQKLSDNTFFHSLVVPKFGWLRTGYQGCVRAVRRKLQEIRPDIVHGQGTERDCAISAVLSGFPNVVTVHGNMRMVAKLQRARPWSYLGLTAMLEASVLRRAGGVVCNNPYTFANVGDLNSRKWQIPNAVDSSFFDIQVRPAQLPTILCVGVICPRKNQNAFLEAITPLRQELEFKVRFLGKAAAEEPYMAAFQKLLAERPWAEHAGFADRERLKTELSTATMLVLPTLEDNCPMVVLEAAAAGVPVAASLVGGVPDLIQHDVNGLLFDPRNPETIRNEIRRLLTDSTARRRLAETGTNIAWQRFHPRAVAKQHVAIYEEILADAGKSKKAEVKMQK